MDLDPALVAPIEQQLLDGALHLASETEEDTTTTLPATEPRLCLGQLFETLEEAVNHVRDCCAHNHTHFRVKQRVEKQGRFEAVCGEGAKGGCAWFVKLRSGKRIAPRWRVHKVNPCHTCAGCQVPSGSSQHDGKWLALRMGNESLSHKTPWQEVAARVRAITGTQIEYRAARNLKQRVLGDALDHHIREFQMLRNYAALLTVQDAGCSVYVRIRQDNMRFHSLFICPSAARSAWPHLRPFIAIDAAFGKTAFEHVLALATGLDAEGHVVIIAWGIMPKENLENWSWFMQGLKDALVGIDDRACVIISDRQKGLNLAIRTICPNATEAYCTQHIASNIEKRFKKDKDGMEAARIFRKAAREPTKELFDRCIARLEGLDCGVAAKAYICHNRELPLDYWATYAFPKHARRWSQTTSNIAESTNGALRQARELPPLQLCHHIYLYQQRFFAERMDKAIALSSNLSSKAAAQMEKSLMEGRLWIAIPAAARNQQVLSGTVQLARPSGVVAREFVCNLWLRTMSVTCTCAKAWDNGLPCAHAVALARHYRRPSRLFVHPSLTKAALLASYRRQYTAIDRSGLEPELVILPPLRRVQRGRLKVARLQAGQSASQPVHGRIPGAQECHGCGVVRVANHNIRTCAQERAQRDHGGSITETATSLLYGVMGEESESDGDIPFVDAGEPEYEQSPDVDMTDQDDGSDSHSMTSSQQEHEEEERLRDAIAEFHLATMTMNRQQEEAGRLRQEEADRLEREDLEDDPLLYDRPPLSMVLAGLPSRPSLQMRHQDQATYCLQYQDTRMCPYCREPLPLVQSPALKTALSDLHVLRTRGIALGWEQTQSACEMHRNITTIWPLGLAAGYPAWLDLAVLQDRLLKTKIIDRIMTMPFDLPTSRNFLGLKANIEAAGGIRQWRRSLAAIPELQIKLSMISSPGYYGETGRACFTTYLKTIYMRRPINPALLEPLSLDECIQYVLVADLVALLIDADVDEGEGAMTGSYPELIERIIQESREYGASRFKPGSEWLRQSADQTEEKRWQARVELALPAWGYQLENCSD